MRVRSASLSGARQIVLVAGATALAWAGLVVHNAADLPGQTILSPESLFPTLLTVVLLVLRLVPATQTWGAWLLLAWSALNLVGGAVSVLPLGFLPFSPEQSARHYAFHGLYAATQLPLIWVCVSGLRAGRRSEPTQLVK